MQNVQMRLKALLVTALNLSVTLRGCHACLLPGENFVIACICPTSGSAAVGLRDKNPRCTHQKGPEMMNKLDCSSLCFATNEQLFIDASSQGQL